MENWNIDDSYIELMTRYLSGNASESDTGELERWVLESEDNKEVFTSFKKAWMLSGMGATHEEENVEENWNQLSQKLFQEAKTIEMKSPVIQRRRWVSIAVAAGIAIFLAIWLIQGPSSNPIWEEQSFAEAKSLVLSDGSKIILNQYSSLSFQDASKENKRKAKLTGDAFFDVKRDETKPFFIQTSTVEIEVLGTSFYVDAREDQQTVQVTVESGSVAVRSGGKEVVLRKNEKAVFEKNNGDLSKRENQDPNFNSLKSRNLIFNETTLKEVVVTLNRHYRANISLDLNEPGSCLLSGTFKEKSLEAVLTIIEESLGIEIKAGPEQVIITGACN